MSRATWEMRAARAEQLADAHPSVAAPLRFYAGLARVQSRIYDASHFPAILDYVETNGTPELRAHASTLRAEGVSRLVESYRQGQQLEPWEVFFARAFLQPATEHASDPCPYCGSRPQVSVLRPAYDGAKRSLVCAICASEWDYRRILCPRCNEARFDELPVYSFDQFDHVRVEACESCKGYLLSIDMSRRPEPIPIVDELAAIPLNLWAKDQGYEKLEPNLLGL